MKIASFVLLALVAATPVQAQLSTPPVSALRSDRPPAPPANAQAAATPLIGLSSSGKVRENPAVQYLLMKTVVAQSIGVWKTRALPIEAGGYNLLKYCWTPANVLGEWGESSGLPGEMIVRALATAPSVVLPNLILGENVVPEFLQEAASPQALAQGVAALLPEGPARAAQVLAESTRRTFCPSMRFRTGISSG